MEGAWGQNMGSGLVSCITCKRAPNGERQPRHLWPHQQGARQARHPGGLRDVVTAMAPVAFASWVWRRSCRRWFACVTGIDRSCAGGLDALSQGQEGAGGEGHGLKRCRGGPYPHPALRATFSRWEKGSAAWASGVGDSSGSVTGTARCAAAAPFSAASRSGLARSTEI